MKKLPLFLTTLKDEREKYIIMPGDRVTITNYSGCIRVGNKGVNHLHSFEQSCIYYTVSAINCVLPSFEPPINDVILTSLDGRVFFSCKRYLEKA